eukprot:CAMPEP_0178382366 /NCGR_PEP_ID=MMETSP0689_2-20121128/6456_1 /TAXON_ID=160604 /ORGANISM="Amphidinium massartii, Strain CS-259" /LENGTH=476 /DNA_ID=CAMNT_0020002567 /DNA_START=43 /DNA_END=1473 /DNA_ORIENTATION=-
MKDVHAETSSPGSETLSGSPEVPRARSQAGHVQTQQRRQARVASPAPAPDSMRTSQSPPTLGSVADTTDAKAAPPISIEVNTLEQTSRATMASAVALWFFLNISIGTLTKWIFLHCQVCASGYGCRNFDFPLAMTVIHLTVSQMVCSFLATSRSHKARTSPSTHGGPNASTKPSRKELSGRERLKKVGPLAACFAGSVGLGNLSLGYIYPSFKQMVGSAGPIVTVVMSVLFTSKRYNRWTWLSMPLICGGLIVCGKTEVHFSFLGVVFSLVAMVLRSAKSIIQAKLLSKEERIEPVMLLHYMAPYASVLILAMSFLLEGRAPFGLLLQALLDKASSFMSSDIGMVHGGDVADDVPGAGLGKVLLLLLLSGFNACFLNLLGFVVLQYTNPVTMQVLGSVKSCLGIAISVVVLGNPLHPRQGLGTAVCLVGVWVYERYGGTVVAKAVKDINSKARRSPVASSPEPLPVASVLDRRTMC